jgi:mRNA turnover protein 4
MPRSKRAKVVHLSKVEKKGKEHTLKTFANIQAAVSAYPWLYVFSVDNMRNSYLKDVRTQLVDSRLFFGKTKVMAKALGWSADSEPAPNTHLLAPHLTGAVGLLFSPRPPPDVRAHFEAFRPMDFARAGTPAARSFTIPAGVVHSTAGEVPQDQDVPVAHSLEPGLRQLGVPTRLVRGKIELSDDYLVCRQGEVLGSGQATLLKMFGVATAEFRVDLLACWSAADGAVLTMGERSGAAGGMEVDGDDEGDEEDE